MRKPEKIVVLGQYKTGTTALFYLIKNSLSGKVRTLFEQDTYTPKFWDRWQVVLAKTILGSQINCDSFLNFNKKIYLVRDPRDWVISGMLFLTQEITNLYNNDSGIREVLLLLKQKQKQPESISVLTLLKTILKYDPHYQHDALNRFEEFIVKQHQWLTAFEKKLSNSYTMRYENLVDRKIEPLAHYLGIDLNKRIEVDKSYEHVERTKSYGDWKNWFLTEDVDFFKPLFDNYISRHSYSSNWELTTPRFIQPLHSFLYVTKTINMKRQKLNIANFDIETIS